MIGKTISHYRVLNQLGAGGMGVVYGADDTRLGRQVALKFIPEELARDGQAVERFRVEARTTSALNHPNICTVYDVGEHDGQPFIVMEWMKGQTLHARISGGMLKIHQIIDLGIEIADALDAAHTQGIVHRDIKPANIFLTDRGHVKVMDFGLAKLVMSDQDTALTAAQPQPLTQYGMTLGTASYMSPEQAAGDTCDARSDLFSLGIVLYECTTGRRPFVGNSSRAVLSAILHSAPMEPGLLNPDLPLRLQQVISDCLEKDPDLRYQNAASLRADLKRVKRDLESGRIGSVPAATETRTTDGLGKQRVPGITGAADRTLAPTSGDSLPSRSASAQAGPPLHTSPPPARRLMLRAAIAVLVVGAIAAAAVGYFRRPEGSDGPDPIAALSSSAAFVQARFELAEQSLQAKQYRDAQRYAVDVLTAAPDHDKARDVRDQATAFLRRAETDIARARSMIQAGDIREAVRALDEARTIDPVAPGLAEVSQLMAARFKAQAEAAELELQRSRAAATGQRAAAPVVPSSHPTSAKTASVPQAPTETPRESTAPALPATPALAPPVPAPVTLPERTEPVESVAIKPAPSPVTPPPVRTPPSDAPPAADDESAIRAVVAAYARAIETKDLKLFRSIKPNLGADEERRIEQGFRAVTSQKVNITIASIDRRGDRASLQLRRQDIIEAGGRRQSPESRQTITLAKSNGSWFIIEIGR
jgi:serine/threonine protein kinase